MENYEIYDGRAGWHVFRDLHLTRWRAFAERKADWCIVQLVKFLMPILEEDPNSMLFQRDGGSALQFESSWIES
jgi:hypothetical protein